MSDTPDELRRRLETEEYSIIPEATRGALYNHIVHRYKCGSALTALLRGSTDCIVMADQHMYPAMPAILRLLHNYAPSDCHGTGERVQNWLDHSTPDPAHWPASDAVSRLGATQ